MSPYTMPINLSNLSAEDIAAATAAMEAARRAHEEATMQREAEERKEVAARKAEAEQRDQEQGRILRSYGWGRND
jgi:hypothetical protein